MTDYIGRWQKERVQDVLGKRRVILLSGARQCGKTTLARHLDSASFEYRTLDDRTFVEAAKADPESFVKRDNKKTLIIDEVQRVPELLPAIKMAVDQDRSPGQYLLTGSANLAAIPSAQESLAGRIAKIRLRPFVQGEIENTKPDLLPRLFSDEPPEKCTASLKDEILERSFKGGYPEIAFKSALDAKSWQKDYISALLDRDLHDIARIQRMDAMRKLVEVLAAWSSKYMDIAKITKALSIRRPTVESYINALEALYITERIPAWTKSDYARIGSKDKLYMTDTGLMTTVLDWQIDQVRFDADRCGKLFETFIFTELVAQIDYHYDDYKLYHYRDWEEREIDFLIERHSDNALLGIEVKASKSVTQSDFRHIVWFRDNLAEERLFKGIVFYAGENILSFGKGLWAIPFGALWS